VCLNFFFYQITARCSRYWAFTPSLASKVSPSPLQIRSSQRGISPTKSRDGPPPLPPKTGPLTRFRWQKKLLKTPKMLLSVLGTLGWVFRCVGFVLESFRQFYFTDLAYGREQKCLKRVLEMKRLQHHSHVKIKQYVSKCLNHQCIITCKNFKRY
jgi:hypothetical protein